MKIVLTETSAFVILGRNKSNSVFYCRPKADYLKSKENGELLPSTAEGFYNESQIISMIETGIKFYTHLNNQFTEVLVVNGHIRSLANDTKEDNIEKLPVVAD